MATGNVQGNWKATDLAFLKAAGWANMTIVFGADGTFAMTGDNPYGMGGKLDIRGSVKLGPDAAPQQIDMTIAASNNQFFFRTGEGMPGVYTLSADGKQLTIIWGSTQFHIARPSALTGGAVFARQE